MKIIRLVVSDLHLGTGVREGEFNPFEDFFQDNRFSEFLRHYDDKAGDATEVELILNGDIFDLLKVKVDGIWPARITADIAAEKLRQCLEGHPLFVRALRRFVSKPSRSITYLPGNHDLDMWMGAPQELFRRYVTTTGDASERVRFITSSDTYYLPEGIQIRHGHQLERIHRVDYGKMTRTGRDGAEVLNLPWGSLWILEVMNPAKAQRTHIDRIQPLSRFLLASLLFDTRFVMGFLANTMVYFFKHRVLTFRAWRERMRQLPRMLHEEVVALGDFDQAAVLALNRMRGVHTLIVGHSHGPRYRVLPNNKLLVNTGTWVNMINLDIKYLGQDSGLTYALIEYSDEGKPKTRLMHWIGSQQLCDTVPYAD